MIQSRLFATLLIAITLLYAQISWSSEAVKAPTFTLQDASGTSVSLEDFAGQPLVLHFWATWCPYCKKVQPALESIKQEYAEQGLQVIAISFREDEGARPDQVLKQRGHSFTTLLQGETVALQYGVKGTPTTFFIRRDGTIAAATNASNPDNPILGLYTQAILQ